MPYTDITLAGASNFEEMPQQLQLADLADPPPPDPISQQIQQPYIINGLTYMSNNSSIIQRDPAGNIKLQEPKPNEPDTNQLLLIEPSIENISNKSFIQVVDTQFKFFKFPATTTTIGDINVDLGLGFSYDPYEGRMIREGHTYFIIIEGERRPWGIWPGSNTWALKRGLPPFHNIDGTIPGKDYGENNYSSTTDGQPSGYHKLTYQVLGRTVLAGYPEGLPYLPEEAFPEGNIYSRIQYKFIGIEAVDDVALGDLIFESHGPVTGWVMVKENTKPLSDCTAEAPILRTQEFVVRDLKPWNNYIGFSDDRNNLYNVTSGEQDEEVEEELGFAYVSNAIDPYGRQPNKIQKWSRVTKTYTDDVMMLSVEGENITHLLQANGSYNPNSGYAVIPVEGPSSYDGWILGLDDIYDILERHGKMDTLPDGTRQIKGNINIYFEVAIGRKITKIEKLLHFKILNKGIGYTEVYGEEAEYCDYIWDENQYNSITELQASNGMSGFPSDGVFASRLINLPGYKRQDTCCDSTGASSVGSNYTGGCGNTIAADEY